MNEETDTFYIHIDHIFSTGTSLEYGRDLRAL